MLAWRNILKQLKHADIKIGSYVSQIVVCNLLNEENV